MNSWITFLCMLFTCQDQRDWATLCHFANYICYIVIYGISVAFFSCHCYLGRLTYWPWNNPFGIEWLLGIRYLLSVLICCESALTTVMVYWVGYMVKWPGLVYLSFFCKSRSNIRYFKKSQFIIDFPFWIFKSPFCLIISHISCSVQTCFMYHFSFFVTISNLRTAGLPFCACSLRVQMSDSRQTLYHVAN